MRLLTTALLCIFATYSFQNPLSAKEKATDKKVVISAQESAEAVVADNEVNELKLEDVKLVDVQEGQALPEKTTKSDVVAKAESKTINLDNAKKSESEIPVFTNIPAKKKEASNPYFRLVVSLGIIGLICLGTIFFTRWWGKGKKAEAETNRIRVVNQHFLGPKKSLAIVRVAGESILVGITENNISHIRTLSLLDEEDQDVEAVSNRSFDVTLKKKSFQIQSDDEFQFGGIDDRFTRTERDEI